MGVLEEVLNMREQGIPEEGIVTALREKGVSPREIRDAISQLKIKNAISDYETAEEENTRMATEDSRQESYVPQPGQDYAFPPQAYPQQEYAQQQDYAPQEGYNYSQTAGMDSSTMIEISEQVFSEKIKAIRKDLDSFNEFRILNQTRMDNINERLKRIELIFDKLQITILEKIGSYGQNLEAIRKEMGMMENSFSKIVEPLVDHSEKVYERKKHFTSSKKK